MLDQILNLVADVVGDQRPLHVVNSDLDLALTAQIAVAWASSVLQKRRTRACRR